MNSDCMSHTAGIGFVLVATVQVFLQENQFLLMYRTGTSLVYKVTLHAHLKTYIMRLSVYMNLFNSLNKTVKYN